MPMPVNTSPAIPTLPPAAAWNVALQHVGRAIDALDGRPVQAITVPGPEVPIASIDAANHALVGRITSTVAVATPAVPTVRITDASHDALDAVRILQAATFDGGQVPANGHAAIDHLASSAGALTGAAMNPSADQVGQARALLVSAASDFEQP